MPAEQGRRTDIENIIQWIDDFGRDNGRAPTDREIATHQPRAFLIYRNIGELARLRCPVPTLRQGEPQAWQSDLAQELEDDADDRSIIFYVDEEGGKGKTWFQQWYFSEHKDCVQIIAPGRKEDMCHAIDPSKHIVFVNVPRDSMQFLQYSVLEMIKDRMVFSTKYRSAMKIFTKNTHVIVFCNEYPDMNKMSADRIVIRNNY